MIPLDAGMLAGSIPWRAVGAAVLLAGTFAAGWTVNDWRLGRQIEAEHAAAAQQQAAQQAEARRFEQQRAAKVQEIQDAKDAALRLNGARLADALERLRQRAERPADMPEAGRASCSGATGAELSGADAAFLVREAARADSLRNELDACQQRERAAVAP